MDYGIGNLAKSLAGHDKDNLFIIIKESGEYVYLVDGNIRKLEKPKCKKKKHIQVIYVNDKILSEKLVHDKSVTNEEIKYFIKCYKRKNQVI